MEILDKIVLHQSASHMELIKYLLILTHLLFVSYASILLGSLIYSLYFKNRFTKTGNNNYYEFSKDLIDLTTFNKGISFTFAFVTLLSAIFGYSQLLHKTTVNVSFYLFISLVLFFFALILVYTFKYSIHLKDIFTEAEKSKDTNNKTKEEIEYYKLRTVGLYNKIGFYALVLLLIAIYFYVGAVQLATDILRWKPERGIVKVLFSLNTLAAYLQFITISFFFTSIVFLYKLFRPNTEIKNNNESYIVFVKGFSLKSALLFSVIIPITIILSSFSRPVPSLSFDFFGITIIALVLLLLISSITYLMLKEDSTKYSSSVLFVFVIILGLLIIRDQSTFDTATKPHFVYLSDEYTTFETSLKESAGLLKISISGKDIYNGKCIACHQFDRKVVGPPHNEVLPKYEGKKDELVKFIMNPIKVNPNYPAMPNQGLKPKEAEAVADYMLSTYKKK